MQKDRNAQGNSGGPPEMGESHEGLRLLEDMSVGTQTLDLSGVLCGNLQETGTFDIRGMQKTAFSRLLDALPLPALLLERGDAIAFSNKAFARMQPDLARLKHAVFTRICVRQQDKEDLAKSLAYVIRERKPRVIEALIGSDSTRIWGRIHIRPVKVGADRFIFVVVEDLTAEKRQALLSKKYTRSLKQAHDELEARVRERTFELEKANEELKREIASRKSAQERLDLAAKVIASSNEAILITDDRGSIVDVNEAFTRITGYSEEEVVGKNPKIMGSGRHDRSFWQSFWLSLKETGQWRGEVWDRRKNGELYPKLLSVSAIGGEKGAITHYVGIFSDISKIKQSEERLEQLAHYDPLTRLPNRLLFRDRLKRALVRARRTKTMVAVMFIDLDGFKTVNDTLGHPKGDELLVAVAERLIRCVRRSDTVARLGGDEFTVVMPDVTRPHRTIPIAQRIIEELSKPFVLDGDEMFTSASIGISLHPKDGVDADSLLKHADTAMYHAKMQGKNNFQFFSPEMNVEITRVVDMELTLRRAVERQDLMVYYQPLVDCHDGTIVGAEALLRLKDLSGRVLSGGPYVPVAEEKGLIVPIGNWVLRSVCRQNGRWQRNGHSLKVAVNVSMRQMRDPDLVKTILAILAETGLDARYLELELTETSIMADPETVIGILRKLRGTGVTISLDDFGTGYSSLSYLRQFPLDKLKIDKSIVNGIDRNPANRALVQAMVTVAHSLRMKVVAEGVETEEQLKILRVLGCDAWQGEHFSPAIPASQFESLLLSRA